MRNFQERSSDEFHHFAEYLDCGTFLERFTLLPNTLIAEHSEEPSPLRQIASIAILTSSSSHPAGTDRAMEMFPNADVSV